MPAVDCPVRTYVPRKAQWDQDQPVDLRWGLWAGPREIWECHAPGAYKQMEAAFNGDAPPLVLKCQPSQESRVGKVEIRKGGAHVCFTMYIPAGEVTLSMDIKEDSFSKMLHDLEIIEYQLISINPLAACKEDRNFHENQQG